jgi:hypothetical protein
MERKPVERPALATNDEDEVTKAWNTLLATFCYLKKLQHLC